MKIQFDKVGERYYEAGVDQGVLYVANASGNGYENGVAWNGLTGVTQSPSGAEVTPIYADNIKYLNLMSAEDFKATVECITTPDEFDACDGTASVKPGLKIGQQARKKFAFSYRTKVGNDVNGDLGYKIHIVYGCLASPSERAYETINDSPDTLTLSYEVSATPIDVGEGFKPTAHIEIDSRAFGTGEGQIDPSVLTAIETALYGKDPTTEGGTDGVEPHVLTPKQIADLYPKG